MRMKKLLQAALLTTLVTSLVPTFSQAEEVIYEEKASGTNIAEGYTSSTKLVYGQTPSFTVKIPKNIDLDGEGAGQYTVGVKGKIPSKYVVSVVPDETIVMEEENSLLDSIVADVTAEKTTWAASELSEDSYAESTNNTIQMQSIDFAKFKGTLNFNISATMPVELKGASDEVKAANNYLGETIVTRENDDLSEVSAWVTEFKSAEVGDVFYLKEAFTDEYTKETYSAGYYEFKILDDNGYGMCFIYNDGSSDVTYLGESYKVPEV